jgi:uncharacterized membrane-anchored protein YitT (DUF2179 family)
MVSSCIVSASMNPMSVISSLLHSSIFNLHNIAHKKIKLRIIAENERTELKTSQITEINHLQTIATEQGFVEGPEIV